MSLSLTFSLSLCIIKCQKCDILEVRNSNLNPDSVCIIIERFTSILDKQQFYVVVFFQMKYDLI